MGQLIKEKIGVLMGGNSSERDISLRSGKAIADALRQVGVEVVEIGETEDIYDGVLAEEVDLVFIALHGREGEDGTIQQFLEDHHVEYTGSGVESSRLAMNKILSKKKCTENGILTPQFEAFYAKIEPEKAFNKFPLVVKPSAEGSSFGMSVVSRKEDLRQAVKKAFRFDQEIMIEEFISGREITVGILGDQALPPLEIKPKSGVYDFYSKYTVGATEYIVPAPLPKEMVSELKATALKVHELFGCRDFSRVDFILDESNQAYVLEINTIPGFTQTSLLPKSAQAVGIDFNQLCLRILDMALKRRELDAEKIQK